MAVRGRKNADEALKVALAGGATVLQAARAAGVSERTAARRLAEDRFRRDVEDLRAEMVQRAAGKMAAIMHKAVDVLDQLLSAKSETVRHGAVRSVIELGTRLRESVEVERRLAALEAERRGSNP